jgi:hypothetical protein
MPIKSAPFSIRLDTRVRDALDRAAVEDRRSLSNLLEKIASDWLKQNGYLKEDGSARITTKRSR